jgi:lipopolysaccharide biosynthesis regulator YciM
MLLKGIKSSYERALAVSEKAAEPYNAGVVSSLKGLAQCYQHEGKTAEANQMLNRARAFEPKSAFKLDRP